MSLEIRDLPCNEVIVRSRWNIRDEVVSETLGSLIESITAIGVQNAILVNESLELVAGYRRLCACRQIGLKTIPARVVKYDTPEHERLAHIDENLQTRSLSPKNLERALAERKAIWIKLYPVKPGRKAKDDTAPRSFERETAEITGQSEHEVRKQIRRIEGASDKVRDAYENDTISKSHVDELVKLSVMALQDAALDRIVAKNMTIAETRLLVLDIIEKNKVALVRDAVKKFKEKDAEPAEEKPEQDFIEEQTYEAMEVEPPDDGFTGFDEVNLTAVEHGAATKRIDNHVKSLNLLLVKFIKDQVWTEVNPQILADLDIDLAALQNNIAAIRAAVAV